MSARCRPPGIRGIGPRRVRARPGSLVLALGVLVLLPVAPAEARHATCFGVRTTIDGTNGDDFLSGTSGKDVIAAFSGHDRIRARGGDDLLCAGPGDDVLFDGSGADAMDGGAGYDTVYLCDDGAPERLYGVERVLPSRDACW